MGLLENPVTAEALVDLRLLDGGGDAGIDRKRIPAAAVDGDFGLAVAQQVDDDLAESLQDIGAIDKGEVAVHPDIVKVQVFVRLGHRGVLGDDILSVGGEFNGLDGAFGIIDFIFAEHPVAVLGIVLVAGSQTCGRNEKCACQGKEITCFHSHF